MDHLEEEHISKEKENDSSPEHSSELWHLWKAPKARTRLTLRPSKIKCEVLHGGIQDSRGARTPWNMVHVPYLFETVLYVDDMYLYVLRKKKKKKQDGYVCTCCYTVLWPPTASFCVLPKSNGQNCASPNVCIAKSAYHPCVRKLCNWQWAFVQNKDGDGCFSHQLHSTSLLLQPN